MPSNDQVVLPEIVMKRDPIIIEEPFFNLTTWLGVGIGATTLALVALCVWLYTWLVGLERDLLWLIPLGVLSMIPFVGKFLLPITRRQVIIIDPTRQCLIVGAKVGGFVFMQEQSVPFAQIEAVRLQSFMLPSMPDAEWQVTIRLRNEGKITIPKNRDGAMTQKLGRHIAALVNAPLVEQSENPL